jgi:hypothetical protein
MHAVADRDHLCAGRGRAVGGRPRADQAVDERAARLRLGRAADADEAAAAVDVALQRGLLGRVEAVAGVVEEDDRAVLREVGGRERARVLRDVDAEVVRAAERLQSTHARVGGRIRRPGEDEHLDGALRASATGAQHAQPEGECGGEQQPPTPIRAHQGPQPAVNHALPHPRRFCSGGAQTTPIAYSCQRCHRHKIGDFSALVRTMSSVARLNFPVGSK